MCHRPVLPALSHLQFSPDGGMLSLRWDGSEDEHLAIVSTNGTLISAFSRSETVALSLVRR